jgi:hypothetical protein
MAGVLLSGQGWCDAKLVFRLALWGNGNDMEARTASIAAIWTAGQSMRIGYW